MYITLHNLYTNLLQYLPRRVNPILNRNRIKIFRFDVNMGVKTRTKINLTDVRISAAARCIKHSSESTINSDRYFPNASRRSSGLDSMRSIGSLAWDDTDHAFNTNER